MSAKTRTLRNGTTINLVDDRITLHHRDAPADLDGVEAGRLIQGSFQPAPFCEFGLTPPALRAIAELIEESDR